MSAEHGDMRNTMVNDSGKMPEYRNSAREKRAFVDAAQKRREQIKKLEAKLQLAKARNSAATRKERNGQLYVWGAMVEGVYSSGTESERRQLREWAECRLTDGRHLQRAKRGFARVDEENAEKIADPL